jgi:hypothetical protein
LSTVALSLSPLAEVQPDLLPSHLISLFSQTSVPAKIIVASSFEKIRSEIFSALLEKSLSWNPHN